MKTITVPINKDAEKKLEFDKADPTELIEFSFDRDNDFYECWNTGIFQKINKILGTNIDDFENESISEINLLKKCQEIIQREGSNTFIDAINKLLDEAIERKTSIHFFF